MITELPSAPTIAAYLALLLAILGLWIGPAVWAAAGVTAVVLGYASGILSGPAALWIVLLAALCVAYVDLRAGHAGRLVRAGRVATAIGILVIAILLGAHALPGFHNLRVAQDIVLSPGAAPYTLYLNFDKTAVGVLILGILHGALLKKGAEWRATLRQAAPILAATVAVLMLASLSIGYVRFEPKWPALTWIWMPANLFLACLSEEAFFRAFIQRELHCRLQPHRHAAAVAIVVSAVTFGAAHFAGGAGYVLLATLAGLGYALVYARTGRIEAAILTHFAVNATHFLLFTYPSTGA